MMATSCDSLPAFKPVSSLKGKDFLTLTDISQTELNQLLDLAVELKKMKRNRVLHPWFPGRNVAIYFEKPSNRTRVSFEVGISDLGAHPIHLKKEEINLGVRETIADTARTLSRYVDAIMIRTFAHKDVEELAQYASVPVINGLTDDHHPCQVLADLLSAKEAFGELKGLKLTYIGDGSNNMAHSLLEGCAHAGMNVTIVTPSQYPPSPKVVASAEALAKNTGAQIEVTADPKAGAKGAHVLYTDVWASMGQEAEAEKRKQEFKQYQINGDVVSVADPKVIVLHCLPAHRGEEITHEVLEQFADQIFNQAENRLHAQKALLASVLS